MIGEAQGRKSPASSLHSLVGATVAPASLVENANVADVAAVSAAGPGSMSTTGKASMLHVPEAGDWSVLPAAIARTWKVCEPSARSV